jgi:hypothetical protein
MASDDYEFKNYVYTEDFIKDVNDYLRYEEKIDKVKKATNAIKEKQRDSFERIMAYMELHGIPAVPIGRGKVLALEIGKKQKGVTKTLAMNRLKAFFSSNPQQFQQLKAFIEDPSVRESVETKKLVIK